MYIVRMKRATMTDARRGRRTAAFLGGINLGKRRVKMDELRRLFEGLGLEGVRTFIASGNVVFDDPEGEASPLEADIERHLGDRLGFTTTVFLRPLERLVEIAGDAAVERSVAEGFKPHVIFLREAPGPGVARALGELTSSDDDFLLLGREAVWLRRGRLTDSPIEGRELAAALGGVPTTMRNMNTIRRMVEKFGGG